jgi:histidine ammonia-lyase
MKKDLSSHIDQLGTVIVGKGTISLEKIIAIAKNKASVQVSSDRQFINRMMQSQNMLQQALLNDVPVYGVNTGYGKSCGKRLSMKKTKNLEANLLRFHGCGTGEPIGIEAVRAAIVCRMICLAKGYSGVSIPLLEKMADFLNHDITPVVPCEGSVGASGDLTPMYYILACLAGDGEVFYQGKRMPTTNALKKANMKSYRFQHKEPLSMLNGTTVMTGIAAIVIARAQRILHAAICASALTVHAMKGHVHHFHPFIGEAKPFPGLIFVADSLTGLLRATGSLSGLEADTVETLQDPYSIRCSPQILGILYDALTWVKVWVEQEANSSNDNPVFDPATGQPLMGGNFYGGHIAFAMDALKTAVASVSDMSDRQVALLVDPHQNRGLPADLVRDNGDPNILQHGFKAMSISTSALTAEALKGTMPATSFSRPTESNNQDKVSMGTIAARDAERICTLVERVVAIHLLAAAQACEIRGTYRIRPNLTGLIKKIRGIAKETLEDRPMDKDIECIAKAIANSDLFNIKKR